MNFLKIILIALIICFCSDINNAQYKNQFSLKQNSILLIDSAKKVEKLTEKEPVLAGFLSLIVPGFALGQLYNNEKGKFLTHSIISLSCITTFLITVRFIGIKIDNGGTEHQSRTNIAGGLLFISAVVFAGNYIITVIDAIVSAHNINKKILQQKYRTELPGKIKLGFSLNQNKKIRLNFAINL